EVALNIDFAHDQRGGAHCRLSRQLGVDCGRNRFVVGERNFDAVHRSNAFRDSSQSLLEHLAEPGLKIATGAAQYDIFWDYVPSIAAVHLRETNDNILVRIDGAASNRLNCTDQRTRGNDGVIT